MIHDIINSTQKGNFSLDGDYKMKNKIKKILFYLLITILPVIISGYLYANKIVNGELQQQKNAAKWTGTIHQKQWDSFMNKTVTSLNILSISIETNKDAMNNIEKLLRKVFNEEPAYGGLYLLDSSGETITGSTDTYDHISIKMNHASYIKEVIKTKDMVISNQQEILNNGQKVIGLAKPVIKDNGQLDFILVAYLRIDYLLNIMKIITPKDNIAIMNANDEIVLSMNSYISSKDDVISLPIDRLPWQIKVSVQDIDTKKIMQKTLIFSIFCLVCAHLLYLLLQFYLFKKRSQLEKKQNEIQKLELVGNLAASSAHEIRNPLTGIKGLIQLLSEKYKSEEDQLYFSIIQTEITRINEIVSQFLFLGKPTALKKQSINLQLIIHELKPLIVSEGNLNNVECRFTVPEKNIPIVCTVDQMKQVILNITKNAFEAMSGGGILTFTISETAGKVTISIKDSGVGIPSSQLKKLFQPFYTSKDTGTGLGLIVCKRIIQSFHGEIYITSKESIGTKVEIVLPVAAN